MTTCTTPLRPASCKLTKRGYEVEGCQTAFTAVAEVLESRQLPMHVCFKQRVHEHVVLGHTLKDQHGRWALEFEVTSRLWVEGDEESLTPYAEPESQPRKAGGGVRRRKYAPIVVTKPWWKIW